MRLAEFFALAGLVTFTSAFVPLSSQRVGFKRNWRSSITSMMAQNNVLVVGSVNADIVVSIPRLPVPGETLLGSGGQVVIIKTR
jgi:hypothetical protein